jgi:hypothetical protein
MKESFMENKDIKSTLYHLLDFISLISKNDKELTVIYFKYRMPSRFDVKPDSSQISGIEKSKQASEDLIKEVAAKYGKTKANIVRRFIRVLRIFLQVREHPKYLIMKLILIFKKAL